MPLKLSIGLSRKVGEANYGSRGATVGLEMEADASLAQRPDEFYRQIGQLFRLARESVDRELARPAGSDVNGAARNGDHEHVRRFRSATPNQRRALRAIAADQGRELEAEIRQRYGLERPEELSLVEASELIDALRGLPNAQASKADGETPRGDAEL
jgi:hypothetical protein